MSTARVKKIPLRKCVGCQEQKTKKELLRVLRREDGSVVLDLTGRVNGRGAYLCADTACLERAFRSKSLERSLQTHIPEEVYDQLKKEIGTIENR